MVESAEKPFALREEDQGMRKWIRIGVSLLPLYLATGCIAFSRGPSYTDSAFQMIMGGRLTYERRGEVTEKEVQAEVDRLLALQPAAPVPRKVLLYEVESSESGINSAHMRLQLHKETARTMKEALEETGLFERIDFLPDIYLPSGHSGGLKALRIAAARAHADGLLIYSTETGYEYKPNALSVFYLTIVGVVFVPGSEGASMALSKAVLVDVKTGYIYDVMESYGEKRQVAPIALLSEDELEFDARKEALTGLAKLVAAKVRELAAQKK